jgi:TetR/AcrR family fatty acid metabolism transcriptional regulator
MGHAVGHTAREAAGRLTELARSALAIVRSSGDKRERILDAAVVEIAQHGYYQTTVAMIARRAGVGDGTIYLYFQNKDELLLSLFDRAMRRFIDEGRATLPEDLDAEQKLRRIVALHCSLVGADRDLAIITQVELRHNVHFLGQLSRRQVREYLGILAEVVAQGQREGVFRTELDPTFAAKAIFGVLDEMATDWVLSSKNVRLEGKAEAVAEFLLGGLQER